MADEYVELEIQKADGEVWIYEVEKDYEEKLGVDLKIHDG